MLLLPADVVVAKEFKAHAEHRTVEIGHVHPEELILDVGHETIAEFANRLAATRTLVWNGPLGAFETPPFDHGTVAAAKLVAQCHQGRRSSQRRRRVVADTVAAATINARRRGRLHPCLHVAGGAFLEWLEGQEELPGVAAL